MTSWNSKNLPLVASFSKIAELLREHGLDEHATYDTVRYRSQSDPEWPIGEGKEHNYVLVGPYKAMPPAPVLELYEKSPRPPGRRGPDKKPRQRRGQS
ncbi:hypothetical protein [Streptomyces olivaceiscleroticus]|uniref:Uncharacterized protein n=1 Tax=Streptomyces olivaceiscleroticus TaxID=68245 RepID=A0ABP3LLJ6_9ACTN